MPYDLTYKWNLINKTNKQAKYNQRAVGSGQWAEGSIEIKNKLIVIRRDVGGV